MASAIPRSPHSRNTAAADGERAVPGMRVALLRADMERHAVGLEAEPVRVLEHVGRHGRLAAELARQRPFRPDAVGQDAAEHARAGRGARDLLDLGDAVDREEPHAERIGARDVALLLDRVAVGDAVGRAAGRQHHLDLGDRGGVEAGAERGQQRQHLRRRVRLHGIEHPRVRQRLGEGLVVVAHDVEVDDEAGPVVGTRAQEVADALGHGALPTKGSTGGRAALVEVQAGAHARGRPASAGEEPARCRAMETRTDATGSSPEMLPWFGAGDPVPHGRQGWTSLFGADLWRADETKKARSVVALSRVPR